MSKSYLKPSTTSDSDYQSRSITFQGILREYIDVDPTLNMAQISFIKCDIEGAKNIFSMTSSPSLLHKIAAFLFRFICHGGVFVKTS